MARTKNWHAEDIKAAVRKRGKTLIDIGLEAGLHRTAGSHALRAPFPSAQIAIANFLGLSVHDIWPLWYDQSGQRIGLLKSKRNPNPNAGLCHRKKSPSELAAIFGSTESPHHPDRSARQARGEGVAVFSAATPAKSDGAHHA
ncbi:MAG: helix-turn-helix domain-containing protein [Alphaproteobacteria bacterium]|nr:helix-turn-helix domain-containing protein [Alphaproteobacteria bacterium]